MPRMKRTKARTKRINMDLLSRFDTEDKKNYGTSIDYQFPRPTAMPVTFGKKSLQKEFRIKYAIQKRIGSKMNEANLKTWEDRNRANQNTKLNY